MAFSFNPFGNKKRAALMSSGQWDKEFDQGTWRYLGDLDELGHHSIIVGYVARLNPDGQVLDIGCGSGVTEKMLRRWCAGYAGVDHSANAIALAQADAPASAEFHVADANTFVPPRRFDAIVMCEVVQYLGDPSAQIRRYADYLTPGGHIIVSTWTNRRNLTPSAALQPGLPLRDETQVWNARRGGWIVQVFGAPGA